MEISLSLFFQRGHFSSEDESKLAMMRKQKMMMEQKQKMMMEQKLAMMAKQESMLMKNHMMVAYEREQAMKEKKMQDER